MTPAKPIKNENMDHCKSIFVPWEKFLVIILSFVAIALTISFSFGSTTTNMKRDIEDNQKTLIDHDKRLKSLESYQDQLQSISNKLDTLLKRKQ